MSVFAHRKFAISILFCAGLGLLVGRLGADSWPSVKNVFFTTPQLYFTYNKLLQEHYQKAKALAVDIESSTFTYFRIINRVYNSFKRLLGKVDNSTS